MFSIVTICKNDLNGLEKTYNSIKNQSFKNLEWIVIDGKSEDGTVAFLSSLTDLFLKYWSSESDAGIYDAMNKGSLRVAHDYVIFLNAGDLLLDDFLAKATYVIENFQYDMYLFSYLIALPSGVFIKRYPRAVESYIWHGMPTCHQAIVFHKSVIDNISYDPTYKISGDYFFVASAFVRGFNSICLSDCMSSFAVGGASFNNPITLIAEAWRVKRERFLN